MKIRSSFVSNSSSSSFINLGKKITNPIKAINDGKKILVYINGAGSSGDAADWCMMLNEKSWKILKNSKWFSSKNPVFFECSKYYEYIENDLINKLNVSHNIENCELFVFNKDYSSPNSIEELKEFLKNVGEEIKEEKE